ncbi:hypothetical protein BJ508DRAFT_335497 [Ascobolus immersus RN42]|uniref:Uncharacterized protein n=1 Tax=Ascobolus immersus RN42 TaxID=1160509 RepID=A0A3N4HID4_ASCIM|nr:hypothetical protein BJ508DRAFT_335497 [Ascobolus immersus RN42]
MKISSLPAFFIAISASLCTVTGQGIVVPEDLPDGVYTASLLPNDELSSSTGSTLLKPIDQLSPEGKVSRRERYPLNRRQFNIHHETGCHTSPVRFVDGATFQGLRQAVNHDWSTARYTQPNYALYIKHGDAVAYMCCYDANPCPALASEYANAVRAMDTYCPINSAAFVHIPAWGKAYGREKTGYTICAAQIYPY